MPASNYILGISALYHDSAATLIDGSTIIAAAQEERFSRIKQDASLPVSAIKFCLDFAKISPRDLAAVVFYESPDLKRERQLSSYAHGGLAGLGSFLRFGRRRLLQPNPVQQIRSAIARLDTDGKWNGQVFTGEHHLSHAASAFYPSPFSEAVVITVDGVGEWETATICIGRGNTLKRVSSIDFPHSLGLLYSVFTSYCGFKVNDGEYKLMGLAPYGEPKYAALIRENLIDVKADGSFRLDLRYFDFVTGGRMCSPKFTELLGFSHREPNEPLSQQHMDLAASIQVVLEEAVLKLARHAVAMTGIRNVCLAGGVALNCVANGKILRSGAVDALWVQPAAGDAGGALGCALHHHYVTSDLPRTPGAPDAMQGSLLGPEYSQDEIESALREFGAKFQVLSPDALIENTAEALAAGKVVGWFQGRMEFGPRALGNRSILADPRRDDTQRTLNLKVKFRESFRPFAPIVLKDAAPEWFELNGESPYMLVVAPVKAQHRTAIDASTPEPSGLQRLAVRRSTIPAVTHVDYSARIQTVDGIRNPKLNALLQAFERRTGVPILVNTSFNVNNEPIVCSPQDAYRCLMQTHIDTLVVGNCLLWRAEQPPYQAKAANNLKTASAPDDFSYTLY